MDSIVNIDKITGTNCVIDIKTSFYITSTKHNYSFFSHFVVQNPMDIEQSSLARNYYRDYFLYYA
jgi:hypothetical protein